MANARLVVDEIMDGSNVEPSSHARALAGLRRINVVSRAAEQMVLPIIQSARGANCTDLTLLDVACGGGDVSVQIASLARMAGINVELTLLDRSETALQLAAAAGKNANISVKTIRADLLDHWKAGKFDVVTCSLFLHHLREPAEVIDLLRNMRSIARRQVVVSDLRRCPTGVAAAWIGSRLLSRSPIVHFDAPASARAAWTTDELTEFAIAAGMKCATVQRSWPWRMLLIWDAAGELV